jgi:hypothetical protein
MIHYGNDKPIVCNLSPLDNLFRIEDNTLCFLFFVRHEGFARLLYMTERNKTVYQLAKFDIPNSDTTFSNKEMFINRFKNWNARILNFAIYDNAFSDGSASLYYEHVMSYYVKYNDPYYMETVNKYNKITDEMKKLMECPFNETICKKCTAVTQWNDLSQLVTAPLECRKEILTFCQKNPTHPFCKCWDTKNEIYKLNSCKGLREIFATDEPIFSCKSLSKDDVKCVSGRYNLTPSKQVNVVTNTSYDEDYTFNKIRVQYPEGTGLTSIERNESKIPNITPSTMKMNDYHTTSTNNIEQIPSDVKTNELIKDVQASITRDDGFWARIISVFRS